MRLEPQALEARYASGVSVPGGMMATVIVSIEGCPIHGDGFSSWGTNEKVSLYANGSLLNDSGFGTICKVFPCLWNIVVSGTDIGDEGIISLLDHTPTMLRINGTRITRVGVRWCVDNLPVESLDVSDGQLTREEAVSLQGHNGRFLRVNII